MPIRPNSTLNCGKYIKHRVNTPCSVHKPYKMGAPMDKNVEIKWVAGTSSGEIRAILRGFVADGNHSRLATRQSTSGKNAGRVLGVDGKWVIDGTFQPHIGGNLIEHVHGYGLVFQGECSQ